MPNAFSGSYKVAVNPETVWGTPVAAGGAYLRLTGGGGKTSMDSIMSKELTLNETTDVVRTKVGGSGSYNFEVTYGTFDALFESLFGAAFVTNVLKVGSTQKSVTFQEEFNNITQFMVYPGAIIQSIKLDVKIGAAIEGSCTWVSKQGLNVQVATLTTPSASNTNQVMNPIDSLQSLTWNSIAVVGPTAFSIEIKRTLVEFPQLGSVNLADLQPASFEVTGSFSCYFAAATYLTDYLAFTERALAITLGGAASKKYVLSMNKVNLTDGGVDQVGDNAPILQTYNFAAKYDATDSTLKITRTP